MRAIVRLSILLLALTIVSPSTSQARKKMQRAMMGAVGRCEEHASGWTPQWASMIGYWKLNENSGATSVTDSSSFATTGSSISGAGITFGENTYLGKSANFAGTGHIDLGNNVALSPSLPLTIAAWIRPSSISALNQVIMSTDSYVSATSYCGAALHLEGTTGEPVITYGDCAGGGSTHRRTGSATNVLSANKWYHVVGVITGSTNMAIYINGVSETMNYSGTGGGMAYSAANAAISDRGATWPFNGTIEEVSLWGVALTAAEVKTIFDRQNCGRN